MTAARQIVRVLGVTALALGAIGGLHDATSGAADSSTFALRARADSVGVQVIAKDAPAISIGGGEIAFVTPASAQSELDSLGGSRSFSSSPYPGDLVISLPGTVSGLLGGVSFPVPGYPFFVTSEHPVRPDADEEVGPYAISAHSGADESHAEARVGLSTAPPQVVSVTSRTSVSRDPASGKATALASTEVAPLSVSQVLRVGDVRATASVSIDPARPNAVVKHSSLAVGTVTVAGVELGLTDKGLSVGGTPLVPVDLSAITALLAGSGVSIEVLPAQETATSITSAGVRITFQQVFPTLGETTVRLVLGQVTATADPGATIGAGPVASSAVPVVDATPSLDLAPRGAVDLAGPAGPIAPTSPTAPTAPTGGTRVVATSPVAADLSGLYPVLLVGGALALVSSRGGVWLRRLRRPAAQEVP